MPGKSGRGVALATHPHLAPRLRKEQSYTSTPPLGLRGVFWVELYLYLYMFRASLLPIIRSYYSVYTAVGICYEFMLTGCWQNRNGVVVVVVVVVVVAVVVVVVVVVVAVVVVVVAVVVVVVVAVE